MHRVPGERGSGSATERGAENAQGVARPHQGGTSTTGTPQLVSNTGIEEEGSQQATETKTTEIAFEDSGALLNVKGGNVKLVSRQPRKDNGVTEAAFVSTADGAQPAPGPEAN